MTCADGHVTSSDMENVNESVIRYWYETLGCTYMDISRKCQILWPGSNGFSVRSVRRYCRERSITRRSSVDDASLYRVVCSKVSKVGHSYGRKTMTGLLRAEGWNVGENRVGDALRRANPSYHQSRQTEAYRLMNPLPYIAYHFGHKLHIDQNEKLIMFGATHILAIDGYSGMIISLVTMPIKNCILIYKHVFLEAILSFGLWRQVRVDHGTEWAILLFIQKYLSDNTSQGSAILPYVQTSSKQNHIVERMWVEVNHRINYPLKSVLISMVENQEVDMDNPTHKFCVSWVTIQTASIGTKLFLQSWNSHPLPRRANIPRGSPINRMNLNYQVSMVDRFLVPSPMEAAEMYRNAGGSITESHDFGADPLSMEASKRSIRQKAFHDSFIFNDIFHSVVNGNDRMLREAIIFFIDVTYRLSCS